MTSLYQVDLNLLPMLAALIEHKSVTKAADAVGLTQPAMSNALSRLRRTLGDPILIRNGRDSSLTARAEALSDPLDSVLAAIKGQILPLPEFDPARTQRTFHIAASSATSFVVMPRLARALSESAPGVKLVIEPQSAFMDQREFASRIDLALVPESVDIQLPREHLYRDGLVVLADASNPIIGSNLTQSDLQKLPHVVFEHAGRRVQGQRTLERALPDINVQICVSDFLLIPSLVQGSSMVAVVQRRLAESLAYRSGLRIFDSPVPLPHQGVDMVWNPKNAGDPACAWLRMELKRPFL